MDTHTHDPRGYGIPMVFLSIAVMLSASVSAYKGDIPRNHVLVRLLLIVLKTQLNSL